MHHRDANETRREKASGELQYNAVSCSVQILEATTHKTMVVRLLTSYLTNYRRMTNKICGALLETEGRTHNRRSRVDPGMEMCQCWPASKELHPSILCGYWMQSRRLTKRDDRSGRMVRERENEREREGGCNSILTTRLDGFQRLK